MDGNVSVHAAGVVLSTAPAISAVVRSLGGLRPPQDDIAFKMTSILADDTALN